MLKRELACLRGSLRLVGRGMYRDTYRWKKFAIKIERKSGAFVYLVEKAVARNNYYRELSRKLRFLPKFYGIVLTAYYSQETWNPAIVSFHEYIPGIRAFNVGDVIEILKLLERAARLGYVLDIKPSNFGKKDGRYYYLDEYGVGKNPIPPDVREEFGQIRSSTLKAFSKIFSKRNQR